MKKTSTHFYCVITVILLSLIGLTAKAQCTFFSSDNYYVRVQVSPVSVIAPSSCPWGYNYNVKMNYAVSFTGAHVPSSLYTLQGSLDCDGQGNFFSLPLNGGSGSVTSVSNPYRNTTDCAGATPSNLKCRLFTITIEGPGLPHQTSTCNVSTGILAVNLASFNGRLQGSNNVYLKWVSNNETDNRYYRVQRSTDNAQWNTIATIDAAGNSSSAKEYDYTDKELQNGMYYYRLEMVDASGNKSYSTVIGASITGSTATDVSIGPNPNPTNQLYITALGNTRDWSATIINSAAAVVYSSPSLSSNILQLPQLPKGLYFVKLINRNTGKEKVIKMIKN